MYNRYLTTSSGGGTHGYAPHYRPTPEACPCTENNPPTHESKGGLFENLLDGINTPKLDSELLIALGVIWFLLSDGEVSNHDLLIIIAVLFVLGV